jgi:hypothetical protein
MLNDLPLPIGHPIAAIDSPTSSANEPRSAPLVSSYRVRSEGGTYVRDYV